jgi:hypothetical protein
MGFDLIISLNLFIDPKTGLPFIWGEDNVRKPFVPSEFQVPEKYRKWIEQRGRVFHFYINGISETSSVDIYTFLENYPDWYEVLENMGSDRDNYDYWTKSHHDDFKEALIWFNEKKHFIIEWSY